MPSLQVKHLTSFDLVQAAVAASSYAASFAVYTLYRFLNPHVCVCELTQFGVTTLHFLCVLLLAGSRQQQHPSLSWWIKQLRMQVFPPIFHQRIVKSKKISVICEDLRELGALIVASNDDNDHPISCIRKCLDQKWNLKCTAASWVRFQFAPNIFNSLSHHHDNGNDSIAFK